MSSPSSSSVYNYNNNNNNNNYGSSHNHNNNGGFLDDSGYSITPSPVINNNDYNRPHSTPARPNTNNYDYQNDDQGNGYSYGSYQGKATTKKNCDAQIKALQLEKHHKIIRMKIHKKSSKLIFTFYCNLIYHF